MKWTLGMMSGTSLDGIDVALLRTDGERVDEFGPTATYPYADDCRDIIRSGFGMTAGAAAEISNLVTARHVRAVQDFMDQHGLAPDTVDLIGFHGQTIDHRPADGITVQIGDGARLAAATGIAVAYDFRTNDVGHGGEGAPLAPVFHAALAADLDKPVAVLNIGGVANVTWIGADGELIAFDTGPGNALIDDWVLRQGGLAFDENGALADRGEIDAALLAQWLDDPYFEKTPPKSLDREHFQAARDGVSALGLADGAATLTAFSAAALRVATAFFPAPAMRWLVCGGGRRNRSLMAMLEDVTGVPAVAVDTLGWNGDALEAQAFAYLARRTQRGLALTFPGTTGVDRPLTGGRIALP